MTTSNMRDQVRQALVPLQDGCSVRLSITKGGIRKSYDVKPMGAEELREDEVQGFQLRNLDTTDQYRVRMTTDGQVGCSCPGHQFSRGQQCKHIKAMTAAHLLEPEERLTLAREWDKVQDELVTLRESAAEYQRTSARLVVTERQLGEALAEIERRDRLDCIAANAPITPEPKRKRGRPRNN